MAHTHRFYGRHSHPAWFNTTDFDDVQTMPVAHPEEAMNTVIRPHEESTGAVLENQQFNEADDSGWSRTGVWAWVTLAAIGCAMFWLGS